ncbi:2844_t:CDS:2 [Diversispora eburnea]|uniref:2844_t:CDS:1 n=1 Tax=Diversispora eburnea TaxID=1213867 RepID=A0A9N9ANV5_9GLOM|nr:2844_t:CDS:2 [Diversispora eburnea]
MQHLIAIFLYLEIGCGMKLGESYDKEVARIAQQKYYISVNNKIQNKDYETNDEYNCFLASNAISGKQFSQTLLNSSDLVQLPSVAVAVEVPVSSKSGEISICDTTTTETTTGSTISTAGTSVDSYNEFFQIKYQKLE